MNMTIENAKLELPKFTHLVGHYSETHQSTIRDVFIGFTDYTKTVIQYSTITKMGKSFPSIPNDFGTYTIACAFENGQISSVKEVVENDNLEGLISETENLEYIPLPQGQIK